MVLIWISGALNSSSVSADVAVSVTPPTFDLPFAAAGSTHGWSFSVNAPIEVTQLGLYDHQDDGFGIAHPVGLWRDDGALLASVTISAGTVNPLVNHFRYASIQTAGPLVLLPSETYVIGYFASSFSIPDGHISLNGFHTIDPTINQIGAGLFVTNQSQLTMPTAADPNGNQRFGPNLMFNIIPAPGALIALLGGLLAAPRRRSAPRIS
jgi:hypothetical protein